jgi:phospholipid/cholesterol/gamma-HCH transport system permease protein
MNARVTLEVVSAFEWRYRLTGRWRLESPAPSLEGLVPDRAAGVRRLSFDGAGLQEWDSSLIVFLTRLGDLAEEAGLEVDVEGLPAGAQGLLRLAQAVPEREGARRTVRPAGLLQRTGGAVLDILSETRSLLGFIGEVIIALGRLLTGRARFRVSDLSLFAQQSGASALGIVGLISLLVGLILAFIGSVQMALFGAQIYVANLVGIGMTRQMGAMMTAVILAGRTGAAFAAQLGSMQVNEEIDAFKTLGISPAEFLVLPRMLALVLMVPLLCIYADVFGIVGGALVGVGLFDIPLAQYLDQTRGAIRLSDVAVGLVMSFVFGVIIAVAGCYQGLRSGRSSAAVGRAATSAVVSAIVGIVVADAIITLITTELGV